MGNSCNKIISACFDHLLLTSAAKLGEGEDHIFYMIQPSLCKVSRAFDPRLRSRFKHAKLVRVQCAASEELSPERFIPMVSASAIRLNSLSQTNKRRVFLADISVCAQARDGRAAPQDTRRSNAVVSLDGLSFWLAILASRQYAFRETRPFLLIVLGHIWNEGDGAVPGREDLLRALALLDRQSTRLEIQSESTHFDQDKDVCRWQQPHTPLEAVLLGKSWLGRVLRHGRVLTALKNKSHCKYHFALRQ